MNNDECDDDQPDCSECDGTTTQRHIATHLNHEQMPVYGNLGTPCEHCGGTGKEP